MEISRIEFEAHSLIADTLNFVAFPGDRFVDWSAVIDDIQRGSHTFRTIAEAVRNSPATVKSWKYSGRRVRFEDGLILVGLWVETTGKCAEMLPILPCH